MNTLAAAGRADKGFRSRPADYAPGPPLAPMAAFWQKHDRQGKETKSPAGNHYGVDGRRQGRR